MGCILTNFLPLLNLFHSFKREEPKDHPLLAFVQRLELSPADTAQLRTIRTADTAVTVDPSIAINRLYGIEFCSNHLLPEGHALLRFGDGRIGHWKIGEDHFHVINPGCPPYVVK